MGALCDDINKLGKGIGNPARYTILESLMKEPKTVGELVAVVGLTQSAVSQHLKTLKACDLVVDEKRGQEVLYSLNMEYTLGTLIKFVTTLKAGGEKVNKNIKKAKNK